MAEKTWTQVAKLATNKAILDISLAWTREPKKVVWQIVQYDREPSLVVTHFMDPDVAKVLAWEICHGTFGATFPEGYVEYKGSVRDGLAEARVLTIKHDPSRRYPWWVRIQRGPGKVIGQGAVQLVEAKDTALFPASELDIRRLAMAMADAVRAHEWRDLLDTRAPLPKAL